MSKGLSEACIVAYTYKSQLLRMWRQESLKLVYAKVSYSPSKRRSWPWWCMPVVSATGEVEVV
jgi:hypothetical protein